MTPRFLTTIAVIVVTCTLYYITRSPSIASFSLSPSSHSMASTTTTPHSNYVWLVQLEFHPGKKEEVHTTCPYLRHHPLTHTTPSVPVLTLPPSPNASASSPPLCVSG